MWDKMVQNDVMRRDVLYVAGAGGLPMPQVGVLPREFFCKYKLWEGHYKAILKAPGKKKGWKRFFTEIGKKRSLPPKKG